ncbi:MAG: VWA domain-containing protein [Pseudomonadales bacterium]|nr:VWA domain-containing protein [Candidatus Woesebacteria bacterium]MCB9800909.1 VWA domain-containing protein [Pseudomonadales bacterium]
MFRKLLIPFVIIASIFVSYVSLFHNDSVENVALISQLFGTHGIWILNLLLVVMVIPISLSLMEIITGEFGLERFKRIAAISIGMTTLSFAALQFIGAIATSSAEGATVVVEVFQQIAHFATHGELEQYGLVGMLTSDASGPWNSSIFPLLIMIIWLIRRKTVGIETKQLHVPMIFQWILYAQQFFFGLDLQYTLLEIILMGITGSLFVWGMINFLVSMFREAEQAEAKAAAEIPEKEEATKKQNFYSRMIHGISHLTFEVLTFNPFNKKVDTADEKIQKKRGGYGNIGRGYVTLNGLQLTLAMTVAMFALVSATQFLAVQLRMSDAEAALFGTAGLTSAPEAFVALAVGPYINALLLVGSNIIDGWMSALGQTVLLGYAEIASGGHITAIPLHPAIRYLTFLSWTQGMLVWAALTLYAHTIHTTLNKKIISITSIVLLSVAILYYFGGAWFSAQALGYGAEYAQESFIVKSIGSIINLLTMIKAQQIVLVLNIIGLGALAFWWSGILEKLSSLLQTEEDQRISGAITELHGKISKHLARENQQVIIVLDTSSDMNEKTFFFKNKWIDLVFRQAAAFGLILDDDGHIPVYTTSDGAVKKIKHLLTQKNADTFIEKFVGRNTAGKVSYTPVISEIFAEYKDTLTTEHDPVLVLFITAGGGTDAAEANKLFTKMESYPIFVQFIEIHGDKPHKNAQVVTGIANKPGKIIDNSGISSLPLFRLTDASQIVEEVLNEYPGYLEKAQKAGILD